MWFSSKLKRFCALSACSIENFRGTYPVRRSSASFAARRSESTLKSAVAAKAIMTRT
jgi:hypothetical protein